MSAHGATVRSRQNIPFRTFDIIRQKRLNHTSFKIRQIKARHHPLHR
jgi:hypothetical protein